MSALGNDFRACQGAVERSDHHDCIRGLLVADCELGRQQVRRSTAKQCWRSSFCSCVVGDLVLLPLLCTGIAEKVAETWKLSLRGIFSSSFSPRGVQMATGPVSAYHDLWWIHHSICPGLGVASTKCENRRAVALMIVGQRLKHGFSIFCPCAVFWHHAALRTSPEPHINLLYISLKSRRGAKCCMMVPKFQEGAACGSAETWLVVSLMDGMHKQNLIELSTLD